MNRLTYCGTALSLTFLALSASDARAQSAGRLYSQGRAAEARDDVENAYNNYAKAFQKKPGDLRYKISYERLRLTAAAAHVKHGERLRDQGDNTGALTEFLRALEIDPSNELATQDIRVTREKVEGESSQPVPDSALSPSARKQLQGLGGVPELKPVSSEPMTMHMTEDAKVIYQTMAKAAGINVLFDPDYHSQRLTLDLANVNLMESLRILGTLSGTFWRPITDNTIFVAQNTRGKRAELDTQAVQTFYLTNVAQQNDLNDIQTGLRNVFNGTIKLYGIPSQNAIIMRGTPDELLLAGKLINDLDKARPEVVVDISILEVSRALARNIGIQLPQTASINFQQSNAITGSTTNTTPTTNGNTPASGGTATGSALQLNQLAHINSTNFAVTIGAASVNLLLSDADTKLVQNPRLRATDGQEAIVRIGQRIPVATGSFQAGVATAITSSLVNTQFQYLDVGVNVDMKPTVHYDRDVSMKLKIEVSSEGPQQNLGGISNPIINQRVSEQTIRLREGESTILSGILQHQTSRTVSGYPGLAELPILRYVFGNVSDNKTDDEIVFLLTPHIVRAASVSPLNLRQVDTGTTNDIQLRHTGTGPDDAQQPDGIPNLAAPRPQLPPGSNPTQLPPGTIPGQVVPPQSLNPPAPPPDANGPSANAVPPAAGGAPVQMQLQASNPTQSVGNTFQEKILLTGANDVYSVPLQLTYDQSKLQLVNVDAGELLGKDGQAVSLVHRDDNGTVMISTSRPPGVAGISGSGNLCTLSFQAKAAGDAKIEITRPVVRNSKQQALPATGSTGTIHIQ